jgi:hypothetical protein
VPGLSSSVNIEPTVAQEQAETIASTIRARKGQSNPFGVQAKSTGVSYANSGGNLASKEKMLSNDRAEQEQITDQLLSLTKELKMAQTTFHQSITGEKDYLDKAVSGLDQNIDGLDKAGQKMGMLRKLTEGRGWFGRMTLYAYIAALWILALVIVFILPKLRF